MASRTNLQRYKQIPARHGRTILEDGTEIDLGKLENFRREYSIRWNAANAAAFRMTAAERSIQAVDYWFGIDVPAGKALFVEDDIVIATDGEFDVKVYRLPDGFTGGTAGTRALLDDRQGVSIAATLYKGITAPDLTNAELVSALQITSGQQLGDKRPAMSPEAADAPGISTVPIGIHVTQVSGGSFNLNYRGVFWEIDNV